MRKPVSFAAAAAATLSALCCLPAMAGNNTLPGVMCQSDGDTDKPTSGALLNAVPGSTSTTKFHCPIIRTEPLSPSVGTATVWLNAKLNYGSSTFACTLRSVMPNGTVYHSLDVVLPPKSSNNGGYYTSNFSVLMPPMVMASVHLRCNVPNVASGEAAGIMSYRVED